VWAPGRSAHLGAAGFGTGAAFIGTGADQRAPQRRPIPGAGQKLEFLFDRKRSCFTLEDVMMQIVQFH
jgi:hypothetical protein